MVEIFGNLVPPVCLTVLRIFVFLIYSQELDRLFCLHGASREA